MLETARTAKEEDARYNQMLDILPDILTGTGSEWVSGPVNRIADFFGIDNTAGKREVFASNAMNMALGILHKLKVLFLIENLMLFKMLLLILKRLKLVTN